MMIEGANSDQSVVNAMKQGANDIKELNEYFFLADESNWSPMERDAEDKAYEDEREEMF